MSRDIPTPPVGLDIPMLAHPEGGVDADVPKVQEDVSDVLVAKPEEQNVHEDNYMPSDDPILLMGLDVTASATPEEEVNAAVTNMDCDAPITTTQMDKVNNDVAGADTDINATTFADLECPYANCQYVTTLTTGLKCPVGGCVYNTTSQVPDDTDFPIKVQLLQIHADSVHDVGAVDQDRVQYDIAKYVTKYMMCKLVFHYATKHPEYGDAAGPTDSKGQHESSGRSNKSKKRNKSRRSNVESSEKVWDMPCYDGGVQLC